MPRTLTDIEDTDPQQCPDCVAYGEECPFHLGYAAGWDAASAVVGQFLVLVPKGGEGCP